MGWMGGGDPRGGRERMRGHHRGSGGGLDPSVVFRGGRRGPIMRKLLLLLLLLCRLGRLWQLGRLLLCLELSSEFRDLTGQGFP